MFYKNKYSSDIFSSKYLQYTILEGSEPEGFVSPIYKNVRFYTPFLICIWPTL